MKRPLIAVVALALLSPLAVPAAAHEKTFKSRVTIENPPLTARYEGDVFSGSRTCVRRRVVQFWYDYEGAPDKLVSEIRSTRGGHWSYEFIGDAYYARVVRVVKRSGDHRHVCRGDRSPTISST